MRFTDPLRRQHRSVVPANAPPQPRLRYAQQGGPIDEPGPRCAGGAPFRCESGCAWVIPISRPAHPGPGRKGGAPWWGWPQAPGSDDPGHMPRSECFRTTPVPATKLGRQFRDHPLGPPPRSPMTQGRHTLWPGLFPERAVCHNRQCSPFRIAVIVLSSCDGAIGDVTYMSPPMVYPLRGWRHTSHTYRPSVPGHVGPQWKSSIVILNLR